MSVLLDRDVDELRLLLADATDDEAAIIVEALEFERAEQDRRYFPGARTKQQPPSGSWFVWLLLAGRGFGKTRTGSEWIVDNALTDCGDYAVVAPTEGKGRDVCIEDPTSGLLAVLRRRHEKPASYNRSSGELQIRLKNGSRIKIVSADKPDAARGFNLSGAWCDEIASWRYEQTWYEALIPALRVGPNPRVIVTSTPKPTRLIRDLVARKDGSVRMVRGTTWENEANLAPSALAELRARYHGTRIGRQELEGELLEDIEGALWQRSWIDLSRAADRPDSLRRVVVAIDPGHVNDETGIVAVGRTDDHWCPECGKIDSAHAFVLADATCGNSADAWGREAIDLYDEVEADRVVAEVNGAEDTVRFVLQTIRPGLSFEGVRAYRGKQLRAEPVSALYEQGRVHHVGSFPDLEDQLCTWVPGTPGEKSPDRLDALVHGITALALWRGGKVGRRSSAQYAQRI